MVNIASSWQVCHRADAGYFAGQLARAAHYAQIGFAIGVKRIAPLWRLLAGIAEDDWHDAIDMDSAQVAVAERRPAESPQTANPAPDPGRSACPDQKSRPRSIQVTAEGEQDIAELLAAAQPEIADRYCPGSPLAS